MRELLRLGDRDESRSMRNRLSLAFLCAGALMASTIHPAGAYKRPNHTELFEACHKRCVTNTAFVQTGPSVTFDATGRFIAFPNDQPMTQLDLRVPGIPDVFVWDAMDRRAQLVSTSSAGVPAVYPGGGGSYEPHISANGQFVAFSSNALNLVPGDTNLARDVFIHDRTKNSTERMSLSSAGDEGNDASQAPAVSANGRYIAFWSLASNLVKDDTNGVIDVFVHDRKDGRTERVSVASDGSEARATGQEGGSRGRPSISRTGRFVSFHSWADNLAEGDTNRSTDTFVHDRKTGETEVVSVNDSGELADWGGNTEWVGPQGLSDDGRFVIFTSTAHNLVPNDANPSILVVNTAIDVFVHDRKSQRTQRISVSSAGEEGSGASGSPANAMSPSGRFVIFTSRANDLTDDDSGGTGLPVIGGDIDVFLHDRALGTTQMVSVDADGNEATDCRGGFDCARALGLSPGADTLILESYSSLDARDQTAPEERSMYLLERGIALGVGGWDEPDGNTPRNDHQICIVDQSCAAKASAITFRDPADDVPAATTTRGANLIGAQLAVRGATADLFGVLELEHLPSTPTLAAATAGTVYGMSFEIEGQRYEIRAASTGLGPLGNTTADFGLYSCSGDTASCIRVSDAAGGFGTTGQRITFSVPLDAIAAERGSAISEVRGWSALGTLIDGGLRVLDQASPVKQAPSGDRDGTR